MVFGDATARRSGSPGRGRGAHRGAANGVAGGKGAGNLQTAPTVPAPPPPGQVTLTKAVVVTTSGTPQELVAGGHAITCQNGNSLHAGIVLGQAAATARKNRAAALAAQRQAVLLAAQLGVNRCKPGGAVRRK